MDESALNESCRRNVNLGGNKGALFLHNGEICILTCVYAVQTFRRISLVLENTTGHISRSG